MPSSQINAKVFINYRREDTAPYAGRLYDRLTARFGEDQVFIDIDQIEPGEDFVEVISRKVSACDIALVAIGPRWLSATDASGKRRLDDEEDFVRMEIVAALHRNIRVIPVLVGGAQMPRKQDLPEALAPLSRRNAVELSEIRFNADVNRLIEAIEKSLADPEKKAESLPDRTTPRESTQRKPATPPVQSTSLIAVLKKPERLILVSAIVLILLGLTWFFMMPGHQKAPNQTTQPNALNITPNAVRITPSTVRITPSTVRITPSTVRITPNPARVTANPSGLSTPAEAQLPDQGNVYAQLNLGERYEHGDGVPKDLEKAAEFYQKAADQGNHYAQFNLGSLYERGDGVPKNLEKAAELYQKAGDQGNDYAQYHLGSLYEHGDGVPKDLEKAAELYQKAAHHSNFLAKYHLGLLYERGDGVPKDFRKAAELYQEAADQGNAYAQYHLGLLYERGDGVPKNSEKARELYQKAADQGFQKATTQLNALSR